MIATRLIPLVVLLMGCSSTCAHAARAPLALRIATFNIEDVRDSDLETPKNERLQSIAAIIQRIRPNILLLNELAYSSEDGPSNAEKFAYNYLAVSQGPGLEPLHFKTYTPPSNTGIHSGLDLDRSGSVLKKPEPLSKEQTPSQREYGNDCLGFGTFPGQYAMALLVDDRLTIDTEQIRTFQHFLWKDMPDHLSPLNDDSTQWYPDQAWNILPLASKNLADVPIQLPNGTRLHAIISHPTPPAFDGPEQRNVLRNHDEIRLIRELIDNAPWLIDDNGVAGGLSDQDSFVILGDLNADPVDGSSIDMTIFSQLLSSPRLAEDAHPMSDVQVDGLDSTDTSHFGLRVDYVLPSESITITSSGIERQPALGTEYPSDHFLVWAEVIIP